MRDKCPFVQTNFDVQKKYLYKIWGEIWGENRWLKIENDLISKLFYCFCVLSLMDGSLTVFFDDGLMFLLLFTQ